MWLRIVNVLRTDTRIPDKGNAVCLLHLQWSTFPSKVVLATAKLEIEGLGSYEEVDIFGFDRGERMFHFFSVTNTAAVYDHKGKWLDDNGVSFHYEEVQDGKTYREELEVKILSPNEFVIQEKDSLQGQIITTMDVKLRK